MRTRALDSNHDWLFGAGTSDYVVNNAAIAQNINTRLSSFLGNCFFDVGAGVNWFNLLGNSGPNAQLELNLAISTTILNTTGVTGLLQLSISTSQDTRLFSVSYQVNTIYSTVTSSFVYSSSIG